MYVQSEYGFLELICFSPVIHKMFNHVRDMENMLLFTALYLMFIHLKNKCNHILIPILPEKLGAYKL